MLSVSNITASYGERAVLQGTSFIVPGGAHTALIGPNGSGKTTLLHIIAGLQAPDSGSVRIAPGVRVGLLRQGVRGEESTTTAEALGVDGAVWGAADLLQHAADALAAAPDDPALLDQYGDAASAFEEQGSYARLADVEDVLHGLGLAGIAPDRPIGTLSGGQRTRLALAPLLLAAPGLLLLDEPTNHLDVDALAWLEGFITRYNGTVLVVSHDRAFLDETVSTILALDPATGAVATYHGNYSAYVAAREAEVAAQALAYRRQEDERRRIEHDIHRLKEQARGVEAKTQADYRGETRAMKGMARTKAEKSARTAIVRERRLEKQLDSQHVEKPRARWGLNLAFTSPTGGAREAVRVEGLRVVRGSATVLDGVDLTVRHGERVVVTGPNGGGKTTLLRVLLGELTPDAGTVRLGAGVTPGYLGQEQEGLEGASTPLDLVRRAAPMTEGEARGLLHSYLFEGDRVFTPIERLSYGERARLALARVVLGGATLLLLDEPTNHLDIAARERFEEALSAYTGTIIAVLHDRYAIARLDARVLELRDGALYEVEQHAHGPS